jgi:hypothetical protein
MIIENAKYTLDIMGNNGAVECVVDGVGMSVPLDLANRHYAEILRQVEVGTLTIADAD